MDLICRACLDTKKTLIFADINILHNFNLLTNLHATLTDDKPHFFCCSCYECIEKFAQFRKKCMESDKTLDGLVADSIKVNIKIEDEPESKHFDDKVALDSDEVTLVKSEDQTDEPLIRKSAHSVEQKNMIVKKANNIRKVKKKSKPILENEDVLSCGLCTETFSIVDNGKFHLHIDSHKNDIQCNLCMEYFTGWPNALAHRIVHLQKKQQNCHICKKKYLTENGLDYHYRSVHFAGVQTTLSCKMCNKVFNTPRNLNRHLQWVHLPLDDIFKCTFCAKICKSKQTLARHLRIHTDKKEYSCEDCGFTCKTMQNLTQHIRRVHLKMVYCYLCMKPFKNKQKLEEHKPKCTAIFTICPVCGKNVLCRLLKKHMRVHSDVRIYKCTRCPADFKCKMSLNAHIDRHEGNKRYKCTFCSLKFYTRPSLLKHTRIHTGEKPYKCKICDKAFTAGTNLKVHMRVHGAFLIKKKSLEAENK